MNTSPPFQATLQYLWAYWPHHLFTYLGMIGLLLFMGYSLQQGWLSFVPLSLALLLVTAYFWAASIWAAYIIYDNKGLTPHHTLFSLAQLNEGSHFVYIDIGPRQRAIQLSHRLTSGHITAVDIYNPQWAPRPALNRWRTHTATPTNDRRLTWLNGRLNLLPIPDHSVDTVILCQSLSELWQEGDRQQLLQEIRRILAKNGRLLLAERIRSHPNWLILGPLALTLPTNQYWQQLLTQAGFRIRQQESLRGILHCYIAQPPTALEAEQLQFNLNFE